MFCILQTFKDNEHYNDVLSEIGDAYVEAIGWLFTDEAYEDERNDYCLKGVMTLPEFMSCVKYFIDAATSRQPEQNIYDYVTQLRTGDKRKSYNPFLDKNKVFPYKYNEKDAIAFSHIEQNIIEVFIWCAYVFWYICSLLDEDKRESIKATKVLTKAFAEHSFLTKEALKKHFLIERTRPTVSLFLKIYSEQLEEEQNQSGSNESITEEKEAEENQIANASSKKGKKQRYFSDLLQCDNKEEILSRLHERIDGTGGKDVAMVLHRAKADKLITRFPTEKEFNSEFPNIIGKWRSISYYLSDSHPVDFSSVTI